jgi:hypothetical protein
MMQEPDHDITHADLEDRRPGVRPKPDFCPPDRDVICSISWSPAQVTFIVHTPPPDIPGNPYPPIDPAVAIDEPIRVVKHKGTGNIGDPWDVVAVMAQRRGY